MNNTIEARRRISLIELQRRSKTDIGCEHHIVVENTNYHAFLSNRSIIHSSTMIFRTATLRPAFNSRTFLSRSRPVFVAFGFALPFLQPRPVTRFDVSPGYSAEYSGSRPSKVPITNDGKTLNPAAVRQISLGSILGFGAGFLLSAFSRSLTLLLGLGIVVWQVRDITKQEKLLMMVDTNTLFLLVCGEKRLQLHSSGPTSGICARD